MTTHPVSAPIAEVTEAGRHRLRVSVHGDLDYDTADAFLVTVLDQLAAHPEVRDLHLDCGGLGVCDSMGLSGLLMLHRRTRPAGVHLHLDNRQPPLERLLTVTGTLTHLTAPPPAPSPTTA